MPIEIRPLQPTEHQALSDAARDIWLEHYTPLVGEAQVHYMIDTLQSAGQIKNDLREGYLYWVAVNKDGIIGYCSVKARQDHLFLSKIYVRREYRGQGLARRFFDLVFQYTREQNLPLIRLHVNRSNSTSIAAYKHMGFVIAGELVSDIGQGYVMDDYVMELTLASEEEEDALLY